jgi:acetolactate synthase I/II/III large subunit
MQKTGSEIVCESLIAEKVDTVFGYPGGSVLPLYDALPKYAKKLRHILTRHEQGAAFAAEGYARATGKAGVCFATSGPGATNLITGIANAFLDSIPLIAITGQVVSDLIGTDAFQEADLNGITLPITKHNFLITKVEDLAPALKQAFFLAQTGRPGPIHIDLAKDAQINSTEFNYALTPCDKINFLDRSVAADSQITRATKLIQNAKKPIIIAGHGILIANATKELQKFAKKINAPIVATLLGITSVPFDFPHYLGMLGMHGLAAANFAVANADLIIAIGARFDDRITGKLSEFSSQAKIVHIDIDSAEIGKIVKPDAPVVADARSALKKLIAVTRPKKCATWHTQIKKYNCEVTKKLTTVYKKRKSSRLRAVEVIHTIQRISPDAFIVTDVGQNQMWAAMHFQFKKPYRLLSSGGLGTMGFGLPAGLGAAVAQPKETVWAITGDGGLQMNLQELITLAAEKIPLKIAVLHNGFLGMVRQWQELFYNKNYSATPLFNPDFVKVAEACGVSALRVKRPQDAIKITQKALKISGPVLVEFLTEPEENVFPMVAPGDALRETRIC